MDYTIFLIIILFVLVLRKYLVFIILCIPLRLLNKKSLVISSIKKDELKSSTFENQNEAPKPVVKKTIIQKIKDFIFFIVNGYGKYLMIKIGYFPSHYVRNFVYKNIYFVDKAKSSTIYYGAIIRGGHNLKIDKHSIIGDECVLDARCGLYIGENVNIGAKTSFWTDSHDMNDSYFRGNNKRGPIKVGNRVWIGPHCVILKQVTIGEGAVIAAGSVVTKDVEPYSVVAGIPAKKIGERNRDLRYQLDGNSFFY